MPGLVLTPGTYAANVTAFKAALPTYETLKAIIERVLKRATGEMGMEAIVQARVKQLSSFAEKSIRKQTEYPDPVPMMNDLCGVRVITESTNDIGPICEFIRKHFEIDEVTTEDTGARLGVGEFGYRSMHFTVALKEGALDTDIAQVLKGTSNPDLVRARLLERRQSLSCEGRSRLIPRYRAEIQVRSLLQHAWANLHHDRVYKSAFKLPTGLKRDMARMAALIEDADENFARAIHAIDDYREYYGTYLPRDHLGEELEKNRQVLALEPNNLKLALKTARLAISLERWQDVIDTLEAFVAQWESALARTGDAPIKQSSMLDKEIDRLKSAEDATERRHALTALADFRDPNRASLLLDYGTAKWKIGDKATARRCLLRATGLDLRSADALIALADTLDEDGKSESALTLYGRAFEVNPGEPRALRGFLQLTIEEVRNLDFVAPMRPTLHDVIRHCRERAALGIYLPWAYYDMGCFRLLLGEVYEGIEAYARAVELSQSETPIDAALKRAERLCRALHRTAVTEWSMLDRFLRIAKVAKLDALAREAEADVRTNEEAVPGAAQAVKEAEASGEPQTEIEKRQKTADAAVARLEDARREAEHRRRRACEEWERLADQVANPGCPDLGPRVVIIAGGCAQEDQARLGQYVPLLRHAFHDYDGTIFSGGTCSGIAQIVGGLPDSSLGPIPKVACLPASLPTKNHALHPSYRCYTHPGTGFSPLGAIQVWADILSQGIAPNTVRVIGISGGKLAGLEYRLALTMGAKVGVFVNSGRAAADILQDPDWMEHPNLIALPEDKETLKVFASGLSSAGVFTEAEREEAASSEHERNVEKRKRELARDDQPQNQPWPKLRKDFKDSILERVDFSVEQLRAVGLRIVRPSQVPTGVEPIEVLTPEQVEVMAEMEHGRWCVQKFVTGWRLGEKKDDQAKTHTDLIPWSVLAPGERDKDRHYARRVPEMLKQKGFAIVPIEPTSGGTGQ